MKDLRELARVFLCFLRNLMGFIKMRWVKLMIYTKILLI